MIMPKNLAIIPARGGSKRIPRKNIRPFLGKPIISYSIQVALESHLFDEVMVSTDEEEIARIAKEYGAQVPFMRSNETANDYAILADVLNEVLGKYADLGRKFDNVCCILATAPLTGTKHLIDGYNKLISSTELMSVYPVVAFSYPIQRCLQMDTEGVVSMHWPEYMTTRSQDLEVMYHDAGTFYWHNVDMWRKGIYKRGGIIMPETEVQDIDTEIDWKLAEMKYRLLNGDHE